MRRLTPLAAGVLFLALASCQVFGYVSPADHAATAASMTRIAAAVNATQGVIDEATAAAPTRAPTVEVLRLEGAQLTGPAINVILGIWPLTPRETNVPLMDPLCTGQCLEELWVSTDGRATLSVGLFEFASPEQLIEALREVRRTQAIIGVDELDPPQGVVLPEEAWIQDNGGSGSRYTMHTYHGRALVVLTMYLPDYNLSENVAYLVRFGEKQIEMLISAGW